MSYDQQTRDRVALAVASLPPGASPITIAEAALDAVHSPATGAELIAAERTRQVLGEGWTPDHDRRHAPHGHRARPEDRRADVGAQPA